jgi:hypothetical protein
MQQSAIIREKIPVQHLPTPDLQAPWIVVTGLDGAGKTTLVTHLTKAHQAHRFRLPYHDFVKPALNRSGQGLSWGDVVTDRLLFAADARAVSRIPLPLRAMSIICRLTSGFPGSGLSQGAPPARSLTPSPAGAVGLGEVPSASPNDWQCPLDSLESP